MDLPDGISDFIDSCMWIILPPIVKVHDKVMFITLGDFHSCRAYRSLIETWTFLLNIIASYSQGLYLEYE